MIEFFTASWITRILITFILGLCILCQTLAIVLNFNNYEKSKGRLLKNLFEIAILGQIFILSLLHGEVVNGYENGIVVVVGCEKIRIGVFLTILILSLLVSFLNKSLLPLNIIIATAILLPAMENIIGAAFPWVFVAVLIFLLVRSIKNCIDSLIAIKTRISALSIIHALDTLHTGVLLCESNGYIVLSNHKMQRLMILITGKVYRNAIQFYDMLISDKYKSRCEKVQLEGQLVYLLPDKTAWIFKKTDILIINKNYIHISAADVSEHWALTAKLQDQDQELRKKSKELKSTISNLHILSKEKEIENAKMRAHDILGQRLSVLLRIIQNKDNLDYDLLTSLSKGLLEELKAEHNEASAFDKLKSIQGIFTAINVDIEFEGELPEDEEKASLFVDIIGEATTNAVRHGFATKVNIKVEFLEDEYRLTITNIGHTTKDPITPGTGIKVMKKKVQAQGGNLEITSYPKFTLYLVLPGGDKNG